MELVVVDDGVGLVGGRDASWDSFEDFFWLIPFWIERKKNGRECLFVFN